MTAEEMVEKEFEVRIERFENNLAEMFEQKFGLEHKEKFIEYDPFGDYRREVTIKGTDITVKTEIVLDCQTLSVNVLLRKIVWNEMFPDDGHNSFSLKDDKYLSFETRPAGVYSFLEAEGFIDGFLSKY